MKKKTIITLAEMAFEWCSGGQYETPDFKITRSQKYMGLTVKDPDRLYIRISEVMCDTPEKVITTVMHEFIHYAQAKNGWPMDHDAVFNYTRLEFEKLTGFDLV